MDEAKVRALVAAQTALVQRAAELIRSHGDAIGISPYDSANDFDPTDEDGVALTIEGDVATLHYTCDGFDHDFASTFEFWARCLWDDGAVEELERKRDERQAAERAKMNAEFLAQERANYERLKAMFEAPAAR